MTQDLLDWIDAAPDGATVPVGEIRTLLERLTLPEYGTAAKVARVVGMSRRYWTERAADGRVPAGREEPDSPWIFHLDDCRAYLARRIRIKGGRRGPQKAKAETTQAGGAGTAVDLARPLRRSGPAPMGPRQADNAGSEGGGLAERRRANRVGGGRS